MSIIEFLSQPTWQLLGLTLVHFLWQALVVAVLVSVFVRVFKLKHGNVRYVAYLLAFVVMIACPVVTFTAIDITTGGTGWKFTKVEFTDIADNGSYTVLPTGDIPSEADTSGPVMPRPAAVTNSIPLHERISDYLHISLPWLLVVWIMGVLILSVRLLMGYVGVYRWRRHLEPLPEKLRQCVDSLNERLGIRGFSRVFISRSVLQAMAVGYLRPMVLLPAAMVMQMQPEMLEAVIAHELAHIRRFDLWVNLAQRVLETLLFYHPAVWWLSSCLRSERELCCDELAVAVTGERLAYAMTLESVSRARFTGKQPILAAGLGQDNKPTLSRVRHVLGLTPAQRNCPFWLAGVIAVLFLAVLIIPTTLALTSQPDEETYVEAEMLLVLGPDAEDAEEFIQSLNLISPDVIRDVRTLFQYTDRVTSEQAWDIVNKLMTDSRPEAKRAAADLLACTNPIVKGFILRRLPATGEHTEYFLASIVKWWDGFWDKERAGLRRSLPLVFKSNKDNAVIEDFVDEITALMISHSGKMVPLAGIELAKELDLKSDRIMAAIEGQRDNSIYDYFKNEHPVRKAVLEFLGEEYVPPPQEQIDYSKISVAEEMQLERSGGLSVGILTSLYTATGPCYSSSGSYDWRLQCELFPLLANKDINTRIYFHPINKVEDTPLSDKLRKAGLDETILNSASSDDLLMCDVIVLNGIYNLQPEVVDALENFVWHGGAIITIDSAGIVSCSASKKFAALQDMRNLEWEWNYIADQTLVQITETALTHGIDLSLPVNTPGRSFDKNSYAFSNSKYDAQILLSFEPDGAVALRVSTYGDGRIAHFGWFHRFGSDEIGERNWQLFSRVLRWAAGQDYEDLRPEPAYSIERYQETEGIFNSIINALK